MEVDLFKQGATKRCVYGNCKSDSRTSSTSFLPFPKPCLAVRRKLVNGDKKHIKQCCLCEKSSLWLLKCKREKFSNLLHVKPWHYICILHFVSETGPTSDNPYPLPASEASFRRRRQVELKRKDRGQDKLVQLDAVLATNKHKGSQGGHFMELPVELSKEKCLSTNSLETSSTAMTVQLPKSVNKDIQEVNHSLEFLMEALKENSSPAMFMNNVLSAQPKIKLPEGVFKEIIEPNTGGNSVLRRVKSSSTQTTVKFKSIAELEVQNKSLTQQLKTIKIELLETQRERTKLEKEIRTLKDETEKLKRKCECNITKKLSFENVTNFVHSLKTSDKKCTFYTGLTFTNILALLSFLSPVDNLHYWGSTSSISNVNKKKLSHLEELIIVLVRLRTGLLLEDMNYRFNISTGYISTIFMTWVQHCYLKFNVIRPLMIPSREKIKMHLPYIFKNLKNIKIIIDCAEFFCESPSNFEHQGNLYSSYKATTTFKVLLGCTPNGAVSFVSELFEGSISDRELVEKSKLLDLLEEGDLVLADRGFTISDLTVKRNVALNIPPFLKGRDRLTAEEEIATKKIAKQRIYIEHVVGKVKQFRLLKKRLPLSMRGILSQVVFVCGCLVNFQDPIIKH